MIKRLVSLVTLILGFGSVQAMHSTISPEALSFLTKALVDNGAVEAFKNDFSKAPYDVDKVQDGVDNYLAIHIQERFFRFKCKHVLEIAKFLQEYRSDKFLFVQGLYRAYEIDPTEENLNFLKSWVADILVDIDEINYNRESPGVTIGQRITELLATPEHRKAALAAAKVFQEDRSNKKVVLQALFRAWENDFTVFEDLASWLNGREKVFIPLGQENLGMDVDRIEYDEFDLANPQKRRRTIGQRITELLSSGKDHSEVRKVAALVQGFRTYKGEVTRTFFKAWERDKSLVEEIKSWVKDYKEDVDSIGYDEFDPADPDKTIRTIGDRINELLGSSEHRNAALEVAKVVQEYRCSEQGVLFRALFKEWEGDKSLIEEIKSWVKDNKEDVDGLDYDGYDSADPDKTIRTIGDRINELLRSSERRKAALEVAKVVQEYRCSEQGVLFRALFKEWEGDKSLIEEIESWVKDNKEDVDSLDYDVFDYDAPWKAVRKIGERINEHLATQKHRKAALELANIVQPHRSQKNLVVQKLFSIWENDETVVQDLQKWVQNSKADVDDIDLLDDNNTIFYSLDRTIGGHISELLASPTHRKRALSIAKIVQENRSSKDQVLRTLYIACEDDPNDHEAFELLKDWQKFVNADITVIPFDPSYSETIGERIATLQRNDLLDALKLTQTNPSNPGNAGNPVPPIPAKTKKGTSWSPAKIAGAAALVVGGGLLYYYKMKSDTKEQGTDRANALSTVA